VVEKTILVKKDEGVATFTLNRPEVLNACNEPMLKELYDALHEAERDKEVRCLVLTGAGRAFCAGHDLKGYVPGSHLSDTILHLYNPVILKLRTLDKPIIASVNGVAAGAGFSLALACDLRIASERASLMAAFIRIGLIPDSGITFLLPRFVGVSKAFELAFTGEAVEAKEAERLGLVNKVVPPEELEEATKTWARKLAQAPTKALGYMKRALNRALANSLEAQLEYEAYLQELAGRTEDHKEGVEAFLAKRPPRFHGR